MVTNESATVKKCYFSGVNTKSGFRSFYGDIFAENELTGLYIIKGGPGTGKSTFLKSVRDLVSARGFEVEQFLCGSDERSLDGVLIRDEGEKAVGILDGTPPHPLELFSPGAAGDILDFGTCWDSVGLSERREEIDILNAEKTAYYTATYKYLSGASKIRENIYSLVERSYLYDKAHKYIKRLLTSVGEPGKYIHRQTSGFSARGTVQSAEVTGQKYAVTGDRYMADIFMLHLFNEAVHLGIGCEISYSTVEMKYPDRITFTGTDVTAVYDDGTDAAKVINTGRFVHKEALAEIRQKVRFGKKCSEALLEGARESLSYAGDNHSKLESIYGGYMDFDALKGVQEKWTEKIMQRLL